MRSPVLALQKNLVWTRDGLVWAVWRLEPLPYGLRSDKKKAEARDLTAMLFRVLSGEALLLGVRSPADPAKVAERMIEGVDLDRCPAWAEEVEAWLDELESMDLSQRVHYLAVPLSNTAGTMWLEPLRAAWARMQDVLRMPRSGPSARRVAERFDQAEAIRRSLPGPFQARPARSSEIVWMWSHAQQRGKEADLPVPTGPGMVEDLLVSGSALPAAVLDPNGQTDRKSVLKGLDILRHPYLKIIGPDGRASYQSSLVLSATPPGGVSFPNGEWIGGLDQCGLDVDWALSMQVRGNSEVARLNARASTNLNDQYWQRDHSESGSPVDVSAAALSEYRALFTTNTQEVEVGHTLVLTVAGTTAEDCMEQAGDLKTWYAGFGCRVDADAVAQEALWTVGLPGVAAPRVCRDYEQFGPAYDVAAAMPITTSRLGSPKGQLRMMNTTDGRSEPLLIDIAGAGTDAEVAPTFGAVGDLGSGKTYLLLAMILAELARGTGVTAVDHTPVGEYCRALRVHDGTVVVDVSAAAKVSVDPLRVFGPEVAGRIAQSFFTVLLNVRPTSVEGVRLSEVLDPAWLSANKVDSTGALIARLAASSDQVDVNLARLMGVFASKDFGRAVFDPDLPTLDMGCPALVFWTRLLNLPSDMELTTQHLFDQMTVDKIFARAVYVLITAIAKERCFADTSRLDLFAVDEVRTLTASPEGTQLAMEFVEDSRKHLAGLLVGAHDPSEFGGTVMRGLISFRVATRQRDMSLAERSVRWVMGLREGDPVPKDLVEEIAEQTSPVGADGQVHPERRGEAIVRDFAGNVGRVRIVGPSRGDQAQAIRTTPGMQEVA